jgi:DNA-directed RNA polymerase specialized sigma24 family protein
MFNLGQTASETLTDGTFTLSAGTVSAPMTLSERVAVLFEQLHIPVFPYVLRRMRNPGRAEEVVQDTFLRLFRYLKEGRSIDNPKAWLFTVANNLAIDGSRDDRYIGRAEGHRGGLNRHAGSLQKTWP